MNGTTAMILPAAAMLFLGTQIARHPASRTLPLLVAAIVIWMANSRGFYWSIFERGEGFFTANRVSANVVFAACLGLASLWRAKDKK